MTTLCLNIDTRTDRWEQASAEFARVGLQVERVSAITGDNPMLAFNQSVLKAMKLAEGDSLLLFEDDVVFDGPAHVHGPYPSDAMTVHWGCNFMAQWQMPTAYDNKFARLHNCWQSHATWYSAECVAFILANMQGEVLTAEQPIFDEWLRLNVLCLGRSYVMKPMIAYQRPSVTDIWGGTWSDYTGVHKDGNKYLKTL